ncbi:MAG: permease [Deltaproteobacteria bacterium]|nr:permease [Deltaproteobacteria bacterium]
MFPWSSTSKRQACQAHGSARSANATLLTLVFVSLLLVVWHVWVYGPSTASAGHESGAGLPLLLGQELWDLFFDRHGVLAELWDVLPYFLIGILLAGYLRTFKIAVKLQAKLRKYGVLSVFLASFIGLISPLCACGTLTTAVSLLFAGVPLAPVMALMVTSPLMSPSTYLLTLNDLGPEWTVIRTVAAFSMGLFAGLITHYLRKRGFETAKVFIEGAVVRGDFHDEDYPDERLRCSCREKFGNRVAARTNNKFVIFLAKSSEMLWSVGKYVLVGVVTGAVVERYMPQDWIYALFGRKDPLSIVWVTLGSVPIFLHQISASSIVSHLKGSLDGTIEGGAALAFMIGGPVTAMPTMVLFWTIFKKRVFSLYLAVCVVGSILIAFAFQALVFVPGVDTGNSLLARVGSLSGGPASVLRKGRHEVRIALEPQAGSLLATYENSVEGHGGVVFDAGLGRLLGAGRGSYDDRGYIGNVAAWLAENTGAAEPRRILVYDTSREAELHREALGLLSNDLRRQGFEVAVTDRAETPEVSDRLLAEQGQLWIVFGGGDPKRPLGNDERERIWRFVEDGRGMMIVSGPAPEGAHAPPAPTPPPPPNGVAFSGGVEHAPRLQVTRWPTLFEGSSAWLGRALKLVNKA